MALTQEEGSVVCGDVVAECDMDVGEMWVCGVCTGKEGGSGRDPRSGGGQGGQSATIHPRLGLATAAWMARWGLAFPPMGGVRILEGEGARKARSAALCVCHSAMLKQMTCARGC